MATDKKLADEKPYMVQQEEVLSPIETHDDPIDQEKRKAIGIDYSGAYEKTDPKEIALVKKLDWYIMPTWVYIPPLSYLTYPSVRIYEKQKKKKANNSPSSPSPPTDSG